MSEVKKLGEITEYKWEENYVYDEQVVEWTKKHIKLTNPEIVTKIKEFLKDFGLQLNEVQEQACDTRVYFAREYLDEQRKTLSGLIKIDDYGLGLLKENVGKKIEVEHQSIFGNELRKYKIKEYDGEVILQKPRQRTSYYPIMSFWQEWFKFVE
jgi:hypothetical protein